MSTPVSPVPDSTGRSAARSHSHGAGHACEMAPEILPSGLREKWAVIMVAISGITLVIAFFGVKFAGLPGVVALTLYIASYLAGGLDVARSAFPMLLRGRFDTDILMLAAAAGAAILGKWAEGAFLLFLFSLGHAGEHYALDRARNAVGELGKLMPTTAHVRRSGRLVEIPVEDVAIDEIVVVRPGDRVPVDGVVAEGTSSLDQSAITGESVPVTREPGDSVFAGTINQDNALDVRTTRLAADNTLARVMHLVTEAQHQQSPTQRLTERFTQWFVPIVLLGTLLVIVLPPLLLQWAWADSFYRGMLLLVAASPCALALGTPAAVLAGVAQAARRGILIKGGVHLENLGRLQSVALDKTGTLTTGQFSVIEIVVFPGSSEEEVLRIAAAVEEQSSHPLAVAIVRHTKARGLAFPHASRIENLAGRGIQADVDGESVVLGALRAFSGDAHAGPSSPLKQIVGRLEGAGMTTVIVQRDGAFLGVIGLADQPRASAGPALRRLQALGIEHRIMLTGDNASVAKRVAQALGIHEVQSELLPGAKLALIQDWEKKHGAIAMVGDGVNDAPALAAATIGVAMGGAGTAVAIETADVALMGDDLAKLPYAIGLSRASNRIIKQNLGIALGVIILLILASAAGAIPLSVAVVFHEGSTVVVVLNALRLLAWREPSERLIEPAATAAQAR
ncbi:MAG: cadmium-translocating P-type ATPase [Opitutaceae bacterium]|nr:cadmium-translocating P-type ATPase [Opitutaceae bacterium]